MTQVCAGAFSGFPEETIRFFLDLRFHNNMTWFHEHHDEYEAVVRKPFYEWIEAMSPVMRSIDPEMELRPNLCLARIHRDIRYTKDKSPYRDHLWLLFRRRAEPREEAVMYWFELGPSGTEWGLGFWGRNIAAMDELRRMMEVTPSKVTEALEASCLPSEKLGIFGQSYARKKPPEQLPDALLPLYPLKEIYIERVGTSLQDAYSPKLAENVAKDFMQLKPMYRLLREAADLAKSKTGSSE